MSPSHLVPRGDSLQLIENRANPSQPVTFSPSDTRSPLVAFSCIGRGGARNPGTPPLSSSGSVPTKTIPENENGGQKNRVIFFETYFGKGDPSVKTGQKISNQNFQTEVVITRKGEVILVDADDFEAVRGFTWRVNKDGYAQTMMKEADGRAKPVMMHRFVTQAPKGVEVDHRDREKLNNTRENLRLATHSQNAANRGRQSTASSIFKGVRRDKRSGKWHAVVKKNGKKHRSPAFHHETSAAVAYDIMARLIHGEFARGNVEKSA